MTKQYNIISNEEYQGNNQANLMAVKAEKDYKSDAWLTFLQAKDKGLKIKKGSKAVSVFKGFGKVVNETKDKKTEVKSVPMGFAYVFNLDQTEKLQIK